MAIEILFWAFAAMIFGLAPNIALGACELSEQLGVAVVKRKEMRRSFRWVWRISVAVSVVPLAYALFDPLSLLESFLTSGLFLILSARLYATGKTNDIDRN